MNKPKIALKSCDIIGRQYRILFSHALITVKAHNFKTDKVSSYLPSYAAGALNFIGIEHQKKKKKHIGKHRPSLPLFKIRCIGECVTQDAGLLQG